MRTAGKIYIRGKKLLAAFSRLPRSREKGKSYKAHRKQEGDGELAFVELSCAEQRSRTPLIRKRLQKSRQTVAEKKQVIRGVPQGDTR